MLTKEQGEKNLVKENPAFQNIRCCVCNNNDPETFSIKLKKKDYFLVECNKCSFIFIPQYFSKKVTYNDFKSEGVLEQVRKGNNWIKIQRHLLRFKFIKKYQPNGDLFDLGAGWGHFLYAGRQLGYNIHGIEISDMPYKYASNELNLPVEHIDFFDMELQEKAYDLITMWDVLEHIPDADEALKKCNLMLKDGRYIVIQVPQIDSFIAKMLKDKWNMIGSSHANYFSKKTVRKLFENQGFKVLKIKSSLEIKLFIMFILGKKKPSSAAKQEYFNKTTQKPKWVLQIMVILHNLIYNTLSLLGIGEEMMVVAKKVK
jgi:2-polyprenyl-3-methyl-5-hydroxy-6-metoxy-1,4-benzoquinol methylase